MYRVLTILLTGFFSLTALIVNAQCPMCRAGVESAMKNDGNMIGLGLNDGILYLLVVPYLAIMVIGYLWFRHTRKKRRMMTEM